VIIKARVGGSIADLEDVHLLRLAADNPAVSAAPAAEAKVNAGKPAREKKAGSAKQGHRPTAKTSAAKKTVAASSKSEAVKADDRRRR